MREGGIEGERDEEGWDGLRERGVREGGIEGERDGRD